MITNGINSEIRKENECRFNRSIAMICSIRVALIAQYLWEVMDYENGVPEDYWRKMPQKMIQTVYPSRAGLTGPDGISSPNTAWS